MMWVNGEEKELSYQVQSGDEVIVRPASIEEICVQAGLDFSDTRIFIWKKSLLISRTCLREAA